MSKIQIKHTARLNTGEPQLFDLKRIGLIQEEMQKMSVYLCFLLFNCINILPIDVIDNLNLLKTKILINKL